MNFITDRLNLDLFPINSELRIKYIKSKDEIPNDIYVVSLDDKYKDEIMEYLKDKNINVLTTSVREMRLADIKFTSNDVVILVHKKVYSNQHQTEKTCIFHKIVCS